jgi:predicted glycosyltransferase
MKIIYYSQHIWGVGHVFRTLEISKALTGHEVVLVTGGDRVDAPMPDHVREFRLPVIMTDRNPKDLVATDNEMSLEQTHQKRKQMLRDIYVDESPDVLMVEFYPFGRNAFRFELDPLLESIRNRELPESFVVSSLRDILVEKVDIHLYEPRVIRKLNRFFDALLVHADPVLVKLDETFGRMDEIDIPVAYTGFVAPRPEAGAGPGLRKMLGIKDAEKLIVVSSGGGKAGAPLVEAVLKAFPRLGIYDCCHLYIFTGPYMSEEDFERVYRYSDKRIKISRFTTDFLSYLAAADLSVSMGGYNTCMNLLTSGVTALVWPFSYDREQGIRARRLARRGVLRVLEDTDLGPEKLADLMEKALTEKNGSVARIDLEGAAHTADWLMKHAVKFKVPKI